MWTDWGLELGQADEDIDAKKNGDQIEVQQAARFPFDLWIFNLFRITRSFAMFIYLYDPFVSLWIATNLVVDLLQRARKKYQEDGACDYGSGFLGCFRMA